MKTARIFLGTDSGATTSKVAAVREDGSVVSTRLLQYPTDAHQGSAAIIAAWLRSADQYLAANQLRWDQVAGAALAIPGPFLSAGVLGLTANLPASLDGWDVGHDYAAALSAKAGHPVSLTVGNDGNYGGVGEASAVQKLAPGAVLMLAPGSGLGAAFIDSQGLPLDGDTFTAMEAGHMPAPLQLLGMPIFSCGCGRPWGCVEAYTTISGLPQLLREFLKQYPSHPLTASSLGEKEKALSLRGLAQKGDPLALAIFDFQAKTLGYHVASLVQAFDPTWIIIGGGLMDIESTTPEFRERYLGIVRDTALPLFWPGQRARVRFQAANLGELSQAIGAAQVARLTAQGSKR
ncbi:MAG: sugar kinase [Spirochaetes bacterium GWD1_61_31]|nr:MAG: sugar kinase [Spirochaetes bacterium GWB1_60_80]OHD30198.1 MAG: sugar kinase [Spirochaetes bacterium GWC1_61_12]OHD35889.1 MAG: sugar kinase [Spirochaetes bacterium GWD1_61_31]OHD42166.1 MAG: sugar kinase [Spirochaetes bacterium GWE1_60_18]OHD59528.1 MAG: sugar kinase [Spirochaetes bacterium GWF1_60_12]HAP44047.1 ROK family protein [Spirochaetaceae bacterium]